MQRSGGPRLPKSLLAQVGGSDRVSDGRKQPRGPSRKNLQQAQRQPRVTPSRDHVPRHRTSPREPQSDQDDSDEFNGLSDTPATESLPRRISQTSSPPSKKRKLHPSSEKSTRIDRREAQKLAEDDADIARLEKKLRIKSKSLPKSFEDEGLAGLLGDLDGDFTVHNGREKRGQDELNGEQDGSESQDLSTEDQSQIDSEEDNASEEEIVKPAQKQRENPFVPPASTPVAKYIPPSRRADPACNDEMKSRLRRKVQGSLNKLSESNLISIVTEINKLYEENPRQLVDETVIELVIALVNDPAALNTTFLVLHASFLTAFHRLHGAAFGARCVEDLVAKLDGLSVVSDAAATNKQTLNLVSLLSHLYNLDVVASNLVFDLTREYLSTFSEAHTEILLRIVRSCGLKLREDNTFAVKQITTELQKCVSSRSERGVSVRTQFMVEEMIKLRDNKLRTGPGSLSEIAEQVAQFRKALSGLNSSIPKSHQPLAIGLSDIRHSDKHGKWWLTGASWRGAHREADGPNGTSTSSPQELRTQHYDKIEPDFTESQADLVAIAKYHGMNTGPRRAIFMTLVSSSDVSDAYTRLSKLNLTRSQEQQIPSVLLHCAGMEPHYNPYYALIARRLCKSHKLRMGFHFAFKDLVKRLNSTAHEEDEDDAQPMELATVVNYARTYGSLIAWQTLPLVVLKSVDLRRTSGRTKMFVELLLITTLTKLRAKGEKDADCILREVLEKAKEVPEVARGLQWFCREVMPQTELTASSHERETVRRRSKAVVGLLNES
ncbi:MAG: hypothetical protein Q9159_001739 [Coniocarpon cinnabarinum]